MPRLRKTLPALLLLAAALAGCSQASDDGSTGEPAGRSASTAVANATPGDGSNGAATAAPTETRAPPAPGANGTMYGMAGLIPPNFPDSSNDDYLTFYNSLKDLGGWAGTYVGWEAASAVPEAARTQRLVGEQFGFQALPIIGFHTDTHPGVRVNLDFADAALAQRFADDLALFATEMEAPLLGIGNEVNRIWEDAPAAFDAWVAALPSIVETIRASAPDTRLFVTFQYESLLGAGSITGRTREPQWDLVDAVSPYLDLIVFTTYPFFDYSDPADLPADYYRQAVARVEEPVAFSEVGWPSRPIGPLEGSALAGLGGSPEEQVAFIERLPELFDGVDPVFVMWVWPYDTPAVGATFDSLTLSEADGTPKPSLAAWKTLIAR